MSPKLLRNMVQYSCATLIIMVTLLSSHVFGQAPNTTEIETPQQIRIGVLAKRGTERCLEQWEPTAAYLTEQIPEFTFSIVPVSFEKVFPTVEHGDVDFVLCNPAYYVGLEHDYGAQRIATLKNFQSGQGHTTFAGVIFTTSDRDDINSLHDLADKTFMAVDEHSFGGWHMAWREIEEAGLVPLRDFAEMHFGGTHDSVAFAVRDGEIDAGTLRSDTLERMAKEGKIQLEDFKILHPDDFTDNDLPVLHSTRHYPEWPIAKTRNTSSALAERVAIALLRMSADSPAARAAQCAGWTNPLNYQPVHECLKNLRIRPYEKHGIVSPRAIVHQYWSWLIGSTMAAVMVILFTLYILRLNDTLKNAINSRDIELAERKRIEKERLSLIAELRDALDHIKTLRGIVPICAHCKSVRDDKGFWQQVEIYVRNHTEAEFSHHVCPDCIRELYPENAEEILKAIEDERSAGQ